MPLVEKILKALNVKESRSFIFYKARKGQTQNVVEIHKLPGKEFVVISNEEMGIMITPFTWEQLSKSQRFRFIKKLFIVIIDGISILNSNG